MSAFVYNYNILSTKLVDPTWHNKCDPLYLKTQHRWGLIRNRLESQIRKNSIICLQELSEDWISLLLPFFHQQGYTFIYDSVYLGVAIAFPNNEYELNTCSIVHVGEMLKKECRTIKKAKCNLLVSFFKNIINFVNNLLFKPKTDVDPWLLAVEKRNRYIRINLSKHEDNTPFNIFNYHMPCAFTNPDLMIIQAAALMRCVEEDSKGVPYILAGDFNSIPNSPVYNLITGTRLPFFPLSTTYDKVPTFELPMCVFSAYPAVIGREPDYTNYSHTKISPTPFQNTIDYIFSKGFNIVSVLPVRQDMPTSTFPNEKEPSDHLPIGAELEFPIQR